ncbi:MAG TPA: hypothetical protein H9887_03700 [Candidatus Dorea intestinavium]|nr:hypothetical protein [Candidatus Dorea intestinavium]
MDAIVTKLIEIEDAATAIVEHAHEQKYSVDKDLQDQRNEFDATIEADTKRKVQDIRDHSNETMENLLEEQRIKNQSTIDSLVTDFEKNHTAYAKQVLQRIIEV